MATCVTSKTDEEQKPTISAKEYHFNLLASGKRADGRKLSEVRDVKIETDAIRTADSSSLVKIGHTSLVCGCTTQVSLLTTDDEFDPIKIKVQLPPICLHPTGFKTQHTEPLTTKILKDILNDSDCLNTQDFIISDDSYWSVDLEVICLNYDGCLIDAALISILSALKTLKLSTKTNESPDRNITLHSFPLSTTFASINDHIVCDPTLDEEAVSQSTFSITIDCKDNRLCHINKTGGRAITQLNLSDCIDIAKKQKNRLKSIIM